MSTSQQRQFSNLTLEAYAAQVFSPIAWKEYERCGLTQTFDDLGSTDVAAQFVFNLIFARARNPYIDVGALVDTGTLLHSRADLIYFALQVQQLSERAPARIQQTALFGAALALFVHLLSA